MASYRLYFMDGSSAHILSARDLEAASDDVAIQAANECRTGAPMELWCRHRKVMRWEPDTPPSTRTASDSSPSDSNRQSGHGAADWADFLR